MVVERLQFTIILLSVQNSYSPAHENFWSYASLWNNLGHPSCVLWTLALVFNFCTFRLLREFPMETWVFFSEFKWNFQQEKCFFFCARSWLTNRHTTLIKQYFSSVFETFYGLSVVKVSSFGRKIIEIYYWYDVYHGSDKNKVILTGRRFTHHNDSTILWASRHNKRSDMGSSRHVLTWCEIYSRAVEILNLRKLSF